MNTKNHDDKWNARQYKEHSQGQFVTGIGVIESLHFNGNENVLDIGCGDGRITAEIVKHVPRGFVLGIDKSANMIMQARESSGDVNNLTFKVADATSFSVEQEFDIAVSFSAFHWIKDQEAVLKNIYRALKPGAVIVIRTGAVQEGPISEIFTDSRWTSLLSKKGQTYFPQTVDSFRAMLTAVGFHDIRLERLVNALTCQSKEEVFNTVFAWVPAATGFDDALAREFAQDIVDNMYKSSQGRQIVYEAVQLHIQAIK